jgi:hypothetical protein
MMMNIQNDTVYAYSLTGGKEYTQKRKTEMSVSAYFSWLKRDWAKAGLILAIFLFVFLFVFVREQDFVLFLISAADAAVHAA